MTTRRTFLTQAAIAAAGIAAIPSLKGFATPKKKAMCGLQLYSLRDQIPSDVPGWITKVSRAGYEDVETVGLTKESTFYGMDLAAFRALLDQNQLVTTSGHYGMDEYFSAGTDGDLGRAIDSIHAMGQRYLTVPYLDEKFRKTADDWKSIAGKLNAIGTRLKKESIRLAYHNHAFEFDPVGDTKGYEILLKNTDPSLVHMEMDLYWVVRAGADPVALFHENPGRFVMWHIKDMNKQDHTLNTEIGAGTIDFKTIMANAKLAGLEQTFMEQENYAAGMDPFASITQSASYIKNNLLVQ